ncbi:putative membrane protein [Luteibacter sp. HA06]
MIVIWAIIGAIAGALVTQGWEGAVAGFAIGLLWGRMSGLKSDLDAVRARLAELGTAAKVGAPVAGGAGSQMEHRLDVDAGRAEADPAAWPDRAPIAGEAGSHIPPAMPPLPSGGSAPRPIVSPPAAPVSPAAPVVPAGPAVPAGPSWIERLLEAGKRWITEGNVPVKVGMLVLFAGVAAFLKYASDQGMFHMPVSVRLSLVPLVAIAGVAFGWMQREKRRAFALSLQGGALGVLVMTVFAAYRLYGLLPATATFGLLIVFVAGLGVLAVLQDALALAVLGLIAGFAAPIIASTGQGNHVALFSYYAVLNLGILGIAWKKAWRVLNVLGFIGTFGVGTAWGVLSYRPALFASTEPFLILHFLLYLAVPWLHVLRSPRRGRAILDGCLMFGNPIASLLLQGALLDWEPMPLAISALVAAAIYVAIAFAIRKREDMGLLRETWAVLSVAFATIAVPLALSASVTASVFALEGAGLIWLGFRQARRLPRWAGVFLQLAAGVAWALAALFTHHYNDLPILNAAFIGSLLLVLGAGVGVWQFDRHGMSRGVSGLARIGLLVWAVIWWLVSFGNEIDTFVFERPLAFGEWLALLAVTAWLLAEACKRVRKLDLGVVLAFAVPLFLAAGMVVALSAVGENIQPFNGWPLAGIAVMLATGWLTLRAIAAHRVAAILAATIGWVRWLVIGTAAIALAFDFVTTMGQGWKLLAAAMPTLLLAGLVLWRPRVVAAPLNAYADAIRNAVGACAALALFLAGVIALGTAGASNPLVFIPVLNPVDLLLIAVLLLTARGISDAVVPASTRRLRPAVIAVMFFIIATSMTLRSVHHLGGVPWDNSMPGSSLAELSLTVVWSIIGVVAWVLGSKRGQRLLWMAGAVTMALVLAKLLLVDRGHLGNLFGIASFMAYGVLCTVIGYLAPAPPRQAAEPAPESSHAS